MWLWLSHFYSLPQQELLVEHFIFPLIPFLYRIAYIYIYMYMYIYIYVYVYIYIYRVANFWVQLGVRITTLCSQFVYPQSLLSFLFLNDKYRLLMPAGTASYFLSYRQRLYILAGLCRSLPLVYCVKACVRACVRACVCVHIYTNTVEFKICKMLY